MAELILKIVPPGTTSTLDNGDIVLPINDRIIQSTHANHIVKKYGSSFKVNGLRDENSLLYDYLSLISKTKFTRVSDKDVVMEDLVTGVFKPYSNIPNIEGHHIYVQGFIDRLLTNSNHLVFGNIGAEIWFGEVGGRSSKVDISKAWDAIELKTKFNRRSFTRWPLSEEEKRCYLTLSVTDFDDSRCSDFCAPLTTTDASNPDGFRIVKRRKYHANWYDLDIGETKERIYDVSKAIDVRGFKTFDLDSILNIKT